MYEPCYPALFQESARSSFDGDIFKVFSLWAHTPGIGKFYFLNYALHIVFFMMDNRYSISGWSVQMNEPSSFDLMGKTLKNIFAQRCTRDEFG